MGPLRLIVGIEALNGLLLITWSASFCYLNMQKDWHPDIEDRTRSLACWNMQRLQRGVTCCTDLATLLRQLASCVQTRGNIPAVIQLAS